MPLLGEARTERAESQSAVAMAREVRMPDRICQRVGILQFPGKKKVNVQSKENMATREEAQDG